MKLLLAIFATISTVHAATRVAVIELGKTTGTVRRTTTASDHQEASVDGVASFWSALHGHAGRRKLQHAGMSVVPDLFARPDSGVVIGLTGSDGIDLENLPTVRGLLMDAEQNSHTVTVEGSVVGHMEVQGHKCQNMMKNVRKVETIGSALELSSTFEAQARSPGLSGIQADVTSANAAAVDAQIAALIKSVQQEGKTVVLHLVVEEENGASRRRNLARRLEQAEGEGEQEGQGQQEGEGGEDNGEENADAAGADGQQAMSGYYGYGYYNTYGEWVTPYKTMFQIQYFNVVLWTALLLAATVFYSIYLMVYMPLMADTLLFGESARVAYDD